MPRVSWIAVVNDSRTESICRQHTRAGGRWKSTFELMMRSVHRESAIARPLAQYLLTQGRLHAAVASPQREQPEHQKAPSFHLLSASPWDCRPSTSVASNNVSLLS